MSRQDLSQNLIHFTRDKSIELSFQRLQKIMNDGFLIATSNFIKGGYSCVCFSQAPLECLESGLVNPNYYSRYSPFGIMLPKKFIFEQGGRPVIYQPDDEFYQLPEGLRWRHVRYEPNDNPPVDFSWEREWRIPHNINFDENIATIIVQDSSWADKLISGHETEQNFKVLQYSMILDETTAQLYYEPFMWNVITLQ